MSKFSEIFKPVAVASAALIVPAAAAADPESCGKDISNTYISGPEADGKDSHTVGGVVLTANSGVLTYLDSDTKEPYSSNVDSTGQRGNGNLDISEKFWDGPDAKGPDGVTLSREDGSTFTSAKLRLTDTVASKNNPRDVGETVSVFVDYADPALEDGWRNVSLPKPRLFGLGLFDQVSVLELDFDAAVKSMGFEPRRASVGIAVAELIIDRDACESSSGEGVDNGHSGQAGSGDGNGHDSNADSNTQLYNMTNPDWEQGQHLADLGNQAKQVGWAALSLG